MSDFNTAFDWAMNFEDPLRTYTASMDNNGGGVIAGINSKSFPQDYEKIMAVRSSLRGPLVEQFYLKNFWNTWLETINSDEVAKRVFDMSVNAGSHQAVKLLQEAITEAGGINLTVDGEWGPRTLGEANARNEAMLVTAYKGVRTQFYHDLVDQNPANEPYLDGWVRRAEA